MVTYKSRLQVSLSPLMMYQKVSITATHALKTRSTTQLNSQSHQIGLIWSNKHDVFVEKSKALMSVYFEGVGETAHEAYTEVTRDWLYFCDAHCEVKRDWPHDCDAGREVWRDWVCFHECVCVFFLWHTVNSHRTDTPTQTNTYPTHPPSV